MRTLAYLSGTGWLLACAALSPAAGAAELHSLVVTHEQGRYVLDTDTTLQAAPAAVFEVLLDYEHYDRISSVYKKSRYLEPEPDGTPRVYTLTQGCILFVCREIEKVERLLVSREQWRIVAEVVPEQSNLEYSVTQWQLAPEGEGTRLRYRMELVPRFWIPPLIGPPIIRWALARGGEGALARLELLAQEREGAAAGAGEP